MVQQGFSVVLTHGNGPQVGELFLATRQLNATSAAHAPWALPELVAATQGLIGYQLQRAVESRTGGNPPVSVVTTRMQVASDDLAFSTPTKPIGPYLSESAMNVVAQDGQWHLTFEPQHGWRIVVPSPAPIACLDIETICALLEAGHVVVAAGGGGIPCQGECRERLTPANAVIDKDLAAALLAAQLHAPLLLILTNVEGVFLDYRAPAQKLLRTLSLSQAQSLLQSGQLKLGTIAPKVQAAVYQAQRGGIAIIGSAEQAQRVWQGQAGTVIVAEGLPTYSGPDALGHMLSNA
jgi:carbamate kinase